MSYLNRVNSPETAEAFLEALQVHGLLYHPEESAADCLAHHGIGRAFLAQIEKNMRATFLHLPDPCETALQIMATA